MVETIVTILISLNLQFSIVDRHALAVKNDDFMSLTSSEEFIRLTNEGVIHDLRVFYDERTFTDVIVVPEVDPDSVK